MFDGPIVTGGIDGAVDGKDHQFLKQVVDRRVVQVAAVVPFVTLF